jgi:glycosyltransferase involved in cell wall biosynthesis
MRLLIVSPWLPDAEALHAGGKSLFHELDWLAQRHTVHLRCYGHSEPESVIDPVRARCETVGVIEPAYTWSQKLEHIARGGWRYPWRLGRNTVLTMWASVRALCLEQRIDAVLLMWTEMGRYLDAIPQGTKRVLVTQDVESIVRPRELPLYPLGQARLSAFLRARRLIRIERKTVPRADMVVARSVHDAAYLARFRPGKRTVVLSAYFEAERLRDIQSEERVEGQLTFFGALDRVANLAAVDFLVRGIWRRVREACPRVRLVIAGANPPPRLRQLCAADSRITLTGYIPDIRNLWAATDIAVLPSLVGGGMLVKVAQAMAAGRPVVTTTRGIEGIGAPSGVVVISDGAAVFAAETLNLLRDSERRARIGEAGRRYITEKFDWETSMSALENSLTGKS